MNLTKNITIKTFIGDLPKILNGNFTTLETIFNKLYDDVNEIIKAKKVEVEGSIKANSITTNNLTVINGSEEITFASILERLEACEEKLN